VLNSRALTRAGRKQAQLFFCDETLYVVELKP